MVKKASLHYDDKTMDFPIISGTENEQAVDISKLRSETGLITMDHGYGNTGACSSAITFLDGEKGILRYRGYSIQDLCEHSNFTEVSYLLLHGELPTQTQLDSFKRNITRHTMLHESLRSLYDAYPRDAHPMALLSAVVCSLSTFYQDSIDPINHEHVNLSIFRLLGKIPTIAAYSYKKSIGQPFIYPNNSLSYCANFLNMMFAVPAEPYEVDPEIEKALDLLFILHADHEQNCSTSTVRLVGSSHANLFAAISAGICALWGPLHGGANQEVLEMLKHIHEDGGNVKKYVDMAKDKNSNYRLMGFGHRVYKNFDPRATIIKKTCDKVLNKLGIHDPLLDIAHQLEEVALKDPYFIEKKLYPNVDFYSGIIYKAMGFPVEMFTVLFAIGRMPGWIAQWKEMMESKDTRIGRPRQIYTGYNERKYALISKRG
ncbi:citrate synthase [bacterium]|nr:citrate synthase [bacterium]